MRITDPSPRCAPTTRTERVRSLLRMILKQTAEGACRALDMLRASEPRMLSRDARIDRPTCSTIRGLKPRSNLSRTRLVGFEVSTVDSFRPERVRRGL